MSLKEAIYDTVKSVVGDETVIWTGQNAPRPDYPYWTIALHSSNRVGSDWQSQGVNGSGEEEVFGTRDATLAMQRYGKGSEEKAMDLRDNISRQSVIDMAIAKNIAIYDAGPVNDTTIKLNSGTLEPRASVDLMIRFGTSLLDNVGAIETVSFDGTYQDEASD